MHNGKEIYIKSSEFANLVYDVVAVAETHLVAVAEGVGLD